MKKRFYILTFLLVSLIGYGQNTQVEESVKVIARAQSNKILVRWGITSSAAWNKTNTYGFIIERFTVYRDGQRLTSPEKKVLTTAPIKPAPLSEWEQIIVKNDYAAILAQALYGERFEVDENEGELMKIINQVEENNQRFTFALFAADMNFEAAKMAGLALEDNDVKSNESYLYRVKTAVPAELSIIREGSVLIKANDLDPLPAPIDLTAISEDKSIVLTWEYELFKSIYTSYFIERSDNGLDFKRLGDAPLVSINDRSKSNTSSRMYFIDTLAQNNKKYHYKVIGVSPFGEEGLPSEIVSEQGVEKLLYNPQINYFKLMPNGKALIKWNFPKEGENQISGFEINWSAIDKGPFKIIVSNIAPQIRETIISDLDNSNYLTITALGKNRDKKTSLAKFIQTIDSIPPLPPIELKGKIDSLGIVNFSWKKNTERDLLGYRIFRGNLQNEEYIQLTTTPIKNTSYIDTVTVASLNSDVYYKVVAVDKRFNMSDYSEPLELKKPDVVPPSSPVFSTYKVNDEGIYLQWINSTSKDLKTHKLYRQNIANHQKGWQLAFETDTITSFIDKKLESNQKYRYAIFAEDKSGLQSKPSTPLTISFKKKENFEAIKGLDAVVDRNNNTIELFWRKPSSDIIELLIYKSKKEGKPVLWKQVPASVNRLIDDKIAPNNVYVYQFRALLNNGGYSIIKTKEIIY